ncbi:carbohydrate ABC transporter permease [Geochorda subterranea]|uniref:Sugar ABC transporter permease n=1 Tax=Geochorda subterranea TaxID=3109564 RepID=A0ABZ1BRD6_9FIRM|nr:sugar ABC transporter permease [Limnochorda sp. LNt]WRP15138.1 sugar ABC transporter permease [Limnochorda sp. LNt]
MTGRRSAWAGFVFTVPAIVVLGAILLVPVLDVFRTSLSNPSFPGLGNFVELLQEEVFWKALGNTILFTVVSVAGHLVLGLWVAMLVNKPLAGQRVFRNVVLLPWMLPPAVVATTWAWMYHLPFGLMNPILLKLGLIRQPLAWLSEPSLAMPSLLVANLWRGFPFVSIILLAGLQSIPAYLYEAASVDGANAWQKFWGVTLPSMSRIMLIAMMLDLIGTVKYFDLIWVMTHGGPANQTEVFATLIYRLAFVFYRTGPAAALAVIMFGVLGLLTYLYLRTSRHQDQYV